MQRCPVEEAKQKDPNAIALDDGAIKLSYSDLHHYANGLKPYCRQFQQSPVLLLAKPSIKTFVILTSLYRSMVPTLLIHPKSPSPFNYPIIDPEALSLNDKNEEENILNEAIPLLYFLSSGSTGSPKVIAHSLKTLLSSAESFTSYFQIRPLEKYCCPLPVHHVGGLMIFFRMVKAIGTVILNPTIPYDYCSVVPTQLYRMLHFPQFASPFLFQSKKIFVGGAKLEESLQKKAENLGLNLFQTYGMTETASLITAGKTTLGHPLPGKELKIKEDHEILVKGDSLFLGYGINPKPFLEDGYFATRDLGAYDPKLGLIYLGRKDRMFTKGGENIYPEKLENLLHQNPKLIRSYILGLDHEEYGMLIGAFIEPFNPSLIKELNQTIENTLGKFFTIHHFFPFPEDGSLKPSLPSLKSLAMSQINSVSPL